MNRAVFAPLALIAVAAAPGLTPVQQAVMAEMEASARGWDAGDLDAFMKLYAPDAVFVGAKGLTRGKAAIAGTYRDSFVKGGNARGHLSFQPLAFRTISQAHQLLIARWTLTSANGGKAETGLTTLLFERRPEGWRIISDHSS